MSDLQKKILSKNNGDLSLPDNPLSFSDHCSNKLIKLMTDKDKILKEAKKAVQEGKTIGQIRSLPKELPEGHSRERRTVI